MYKSAKSITSSLVIVLCLFLSCNNNIVFCEFQSVPKKIWDKQSGFYFHFNLNDASIPYDITLQLRNNIYYPYQNLWILFEAHLSSEIAVKDTIEYIIANDFGKWTGNGITLFQNQFPLRSTYHFPDTGKYTVCISHGMLDDRLKGIENIGLLIEKAR